MNTAPPTAEEFRRILRAEIEKISLPQRRVARRAESYRSWTPIASANKSMELAHGMWRLSRTRYLAACCTILLHGYAIASPDESPPPTADFPRAESFYPYAARVWAQEGTTVVRYCVDANGHLSGDPTVERTSGDEDLDGAALALAKAGDDHYVPAYEAGKATAGCAKLNVHFALEDDPAFPTLSRRSKQLTNESRPQLQSLQKEVQRAQRPPDLAGIAAGDRQQLMQLRNFVAGATPLVKQYDTLLADFVSKMDELGRADDVSEAERTAFSKSWQEKRARINELRAVVLDMRAVLNTVNELADYVESAKPPQRAEIDELIARVRAEYDQLQTRSPPQVAPLLVESVAGLEYSAAAMPGVAAPVKVTSAKEIANSCQYPPTANRNLEEGTTQLRLHLDATGAVSAAAVARSSGYDELDAAALKCVATVRFQPASQDGKPVAAVVRYGWTWKIDWGSPDPNKCADLKAAAEARPHPPANNPAEKPTATLCTCWEESGKTRGPQIVESTGSQRLDDGAIKLAMAAAPTPRPPGHAGCSAYRMQFELQNPAPRK
jgi:TonB family protein